MGKALIIVDVQNDFVEGGSLAVEGGRDLAQRIGKLVQQNANDYDIVVTTQDWHIDPGTHFSETPNYVDSWPVHCVAETEGAEIVTELANVLGGLVINKDLDLVHIVKGEFKDAYSGFEGHIKGDNEFATLENELKTAGVTAVDIVGIATDYCVKATAEQAKENGFDTTVLKGYCVGINAENVTELINTGFANLGINVK